jgi:diguanylate cyclase (GGDEF)-like protein
MDKPVIKVLLFEDNDTDALLLQEALAKDNLSSFEFVTVERLNAGLEVLRAGNFDLILLDLGLPDSTGLETFERVHYEFPNIPLVMLTGLMDEKLALEAIQAGAQDYLIKGQVGWEIAPRAIRYAIERKRMEERLQHMATHDTLTGLPNRKLFQDRLNHAIERAQRSRSGNNEKWELAVMMLDLDNFKSANDTFGHAQGDFLLQTVTEKLRGCIRGSDTIARIGGDEFTLILENVSGMDDAGGLARKVMTAFDQPFLLDGREFRVTASIGVSLFPRDGQDAETLLKHADIAMYRAKWDKNTFRFFEERGSTDI